MYVHHSLPHTHAHNNILDTQQATGNHMRFETQHKYVGLQICTHTAGASHPSHSLQPWGTAQVLWWWAADRPAAARPGPACARNRSRVAEAADTHNTSSRPGNNPAQEHSADSTIDPLCGRATTCCMQPTSLPRALVPHIYDLTLSTRT